MIHTHPRHPSTPRRPEPRTRSSGVPRRDDRGQTTAEYALLTGAVAAIVAAVVAWASSTGAIGNLMESVFSGLLG